MAIKRIPRLAQLIKLAKSICDVIEAGGPVIRQFVPDEDKQRYDDALLAILSACAVLRSIAYEDGRVSVELPWGE